MGAFAGCPWLQSPDLQGRHPQGPESGRNPDWPGPPRRPEGPARSSPRGTATPTLPLPAAGDPAGWQRPLHQAIRSRTSKNAGARAKQVVIGAPSLTRPGELVSEQQRSGRERERQGLAAMPRPRPALRRLPPEWCAALPPPALSPGGKQATSLSPGSGRTRPRPSRPRRSAGHKSKTNWPQGRASSVASATRPQSHGQVQTQPLREQSARSR